MTTEAQSKPVKISLAEYFEMEFRSEKRHEYHDGLVVEMTYASDNHELIVANLLRILGNCLLDSDCVVYPSNRMLYVPACNKVFYPDASIYCSKRETYRYSENMTALLNPSVLIEVLSDSTQRDDKEKKWRCYRQTTSLKQYVLIAQDEFYIKTLNRTTTENEWLQIETDDEDAILKIGDCDVSMSDIYRNTVFESGERQAG